MTDDLFDAPHDDTTGADMSQEQSVSGDGGQEAARPGKAEESGKETAGQEQEQNRPKAEQDKGEAEKDEPLVEYKDFAVPDGYGIDSGLLDKFKGFAREKGLSQQEAQALIDMQVQTHELAAKSHMDQRMAWRKEIREDREFGGGNFESTLKHAERGLEAFDPDKKIGKFLAESGYGDNPDIIKAFARFSKQYLKNLGEDETYTGTRGGTDKKPLEERLWPDMQD